jgi:hypothetical protein
MREPKRKWWARPGRLCALERPGGGGRSHRPERRRDEIEWLQAHGVHTVISTMKTRHNLAAYEEAGLEWVHLPVEEDDDGVDQVLPVLRRKLRRAGAVAIHANRRTDFVTRACAEYLRDRYGVPVEESLASAAEAGFSPSR